MAKQKGIIKLKGTIDEFTFYKTKDGYIAKQKTSLDGSRIATDPNFARTRENGKEFGAAAKDGKLLREALRNNIILAHDSRVTSRLTKLMSQILKLDGTSARGARTVGIAIALPSAMIMLKGFNFNQNAILSQVMHTPYTLVAATGVINITSFTPINDVTPPQGATHVSLISAWAKVDFVNKIYSVQNSNVVNLPINGTSTPVTLTPVAPPTGTGTNIYLLQVEFFQLVNGIQYTLNNGTTNALEIVQVA